MKKKMCLVYISIFDGYIEWCCLVLVQLMLQYKHFGGRYGMRYL